MISELKEKIVDKYLTWKTGKNAEQRALVKWNEENLGCTRSVKSYLGNYKHIVEVDWHKIYGFHDFTGWFIWKEFRDKYMYPHRELGDHATVFSIRGEYDEYYICDNNCFGGDHVFVGTNSKEDAIMIALKYK